MSGLENSVQDLTDIVSIFELFFDNDLVQRLVDGTSCYAQQFKGSRGNIFSKQPMVVGEICIVLALSILMGIVQKCSLKLYFSLYQPVATPIFGSVISLDTLE
jgi:hypothetical protein